MVLTQRRRGRRRWNVNLLAAKDRNCTDLWLEDKNSMSVAMTWQFVTLAVSRVTVFTRKRQSTGKYNIILNISQRQTVQYSFEVGWLAKSQCLIEVEVQLSQIVVTGRYTTFSSNKKMVIILHRELKRKVEKVLQMKLDDPTSISKFSREFVVPGWGMRERLSGAFDITRS